MCSSNFFLLAQVIPEIVLSEKPSTLKNLVYSRQMTSYVFVAYLAHYLIEYVHFRASLVKNLPAMLETWVQFLGWGDPLEEGLATHSSILAWRFPWTEESGGPWGHRELNTTEWWSTSGHFKALQTCCKCEKFWELNHIQKVKDRQRHIWSSLDFPVLHFLTLNCSFFAVDPWSSSRSMKYCSQQKGFPIVCAFLSVSWTVLIHKAMP